MLVPEPRASRTLRVPDPSANLPQGLRVWKGRLNLRNSLWKAGPSLQKQSWTGMSSMANCACWNCWAGGLLLIQGRSGLHRELQANQGHRVTLSKMKERERDRVGDQGWVKKRLSQ